ncbi:MAG: hypothetical protein LBN92_07410 [Treponema sp.]|jgi:hypothetical protein|nr:hypothetical protein [Treponema sp.]
MSIIPSTFNRGIQSYTAVGGTERGGASGVSAVLLNRGARYPRRSFFQELEKVGFDYVISMEGEEERYDLEELSGRFPFVRFIFLRETLNAGQMINLAAAELSGGLFLAFWNDQKLFNGITAAKMAEYFAGKRLCTAPVIQNARFEALPTLTIPLYDRYLKTVQETPEREGHATLFPFDWTGLYDRGRFIRLGGFDGAISTPYWQLMDFGFRAFLWGEEIRGTRLFRFVYNGEREAEDFTTDASYRLFYLKNLAPVFRGDHAYLPLRRYPSFLAKSGWDLLGSWYEFSHERAWVKQNASRFRVDARTLTDRWETP